MKKNEIPIHNLTAPPLDPQPAISETETDEKIIIPVSNIRDFLEERIKPLPHLLERITPHPSLTVLGGPPKIGKSLFALQLSQALIGSEDFLGFQISRPWDVYLVQAEIPSSLMQIRLRSMGGWDHMSVGNLYLSNTAFDLFDSDSVQKLAENIREKHADLLILDPLISFHSGDENNSQDMSRLFGILKKLQFELGISILIIHHFHKPGDGFRSGAEKLRGSSVIHAVGDAYLCMEGPNAAGVVTLTFDLRHFENPQNIPIKLNPKNLRFEVCRKEAKNNANVAVIAKIMESEPRLKTKEVVERFIKATGKSDSTAYKALEKYKAGKGEAGSGK